MFIGRIQDGTIYGTWTVRQWEGQEELSDDDAEVAAFGVHLPSTAQERRDAIQAQIDAMERTQIMPRITRESLLLIMVSTAAGMGLTEPQLYAVNVGYSRLKDFDASIAALRDQMAAIV